MPEGKEYFSAEFRDLFERMMRYIPEERLTIDEILAHSWYQQEACTREEAIAEMNNRKPKLKANKLLEKDAANAKIVTSKKYKRGSGDVLDEEKLASILKIERAINSVDLKPTLDSIEAVLFSRMDAISFLEIIYRKAHELGL